MMEEDYSRHLNQLLEACECDLAVASEWQDKLARRGVIPSIPGDRRRFLRHRFNGRAVLEYSQTIFSIASEHMMAKVVTRDISRGGIAFLHSDQLFPGERITL